MSNLERIGLTLAVAIGLFFLLYGLMYVATQAGMSFNSRHPNSHERQGR